MKTLYTLILMVWFCPLALAQTTVTIVLSGNGDDATVDNYNPGNNYPNEIELCSRAWTIGNVPVFWRSFFRFNMQCIPVNATIISAHLSLFYADSNSFGNSQHASLTSSNESVIQMVMSPWSENTISWNNQPATTTNFQSTLLQSTSGTQNYLNTDVTQMVQAMISGNNYGFMLRLANETAYAQMFFASGDHANVSKHPTLVVTYSLPVVGCINMFIDSTEEDATIDDYNPMNNNPDEIEYASRAWTIGNNPVRWRSLFRFNLQCIPSNAIVASANLSLYHAHMNNFGNAQHISLTNSNESVIQMVTSPWSENTVTWSNQPGYTTAMQVVLNQSTNGTQDYLNMNVTQMVQAMVSGNNYGFMLRLSFELAYAQLFFASGDNPDLTKHPKLEVCYSIPTGIFETTNIGDVSIYPNPASEFVLIALPESATSPIIKLYNSSGQCVYQKRFVKTGSAVSININDFPSGIYMVNVITEKTQFHRKLMITH